MILLCIVKSEASRGYKSKSVHDAHICNAGCTAALSSPWGYNINQLILIGYKAEIGKQNSEIGNHVICILEDPCIGLCITCIAAPLWCHNDYSAIKYTKK